MTESNPYKTAEEIKALLHFTPASVMCKHSGCQKSIGCSSDSVRRHMKTHFDFPPVPGLKQFIEEGLLDARLYPIENFLIDSSNPKERMKYICNRCNMQTNEKKTMLNHIASKAVCSTYRLTKCAKLICGYYFPYDLMIQQPTAPEEAQTSPSPTTPTNTSTSSMLTTSMRMPRIDTNHKLSLSYLTNTKVSLENKIGSLVHSSDEIGDWPVVLHKFFKQEGWEATVQSFLDAVNDCPTFEIEKISRAGDVFFENIYFVLFDIRTDVAAALVQFKMASAQVQAEAWAFSPRESYVRVKSLFKNLICYLFLKQVSVLNPLLDSVRQSTWTLEVFYQNNFIGQLLYALALEEVGSGEMTHLELFSILCCFKKRPAVQDNTGGFSLRDCGSCATTLGSILHMVRCGVAAFIVAADSNGNRLTDNGKRLAEKCNEGSFVNSVSRYINKLRVMANQKPKTRQMDTDEHHNIVIDGIRFSQKIWSRLVVLTCQMMQEVLSHLFENTDYLIFLELQNDLEVVSFDRANVMVTCGSSGKTIDLSSLPVVTQSSDIFLENYHKYISLIEFCLFGFGLGCIRLPQVKNLSMKSIQWGNDNYQDLSLVTTHKKKGRIQSSPNKAVTQKMPRQVTRFIVLARRLILHQLEQEGASIPNFLSQYRFFPKLSDNQRKVTIEDVATELFKSSQKISDGVLRQFFTSLTNILFPSQLGAAIMSALSSDDDEAAAATSIVTDDVIAAQSHHSALTAARAYATNSDDMLEKAFRIYHRAIGAPDVVCLAEKVTKAVAVIPKDTQLRALRQLTGKDDANFLPNQYEAVNCCVNFPGRHKLVSLPCGNGKTMLVMIPVVCQELQQHELTCHVLLEPYRFLTSYLLEDIAASLRSVSPDLTVKSYTGADINEESEQLPVLPLPNILILTLDAFGKIVEYFKESFIDHCKRGKVSSIYLDEVQTILLESDLREKSYKKLQHLPEFGVDVVAMSGSLGTGIGKEIMEWLGLSSKSEHRHAMFVGNGDPLGQGPFNLHVVIHSHCIVDRAFTIIEGLNGDPHHHVHVICAKIAQVDKLTCKLQEQNIPVVSATGSMDREEMTKAASQWSNGSSRVLVSTTCGVVGNQNNKCRTVIVLDLLYDLNNYIQAMGRLRLPQRLKGASVYLVLGSEIFSKRKINDSSRSTDEVMSRLTKMNIGSSDSTRNACLLTCTEEGVRHWLQQTGCLKVSLARCFGWYSTAPCGQCTNCANDHDMQMQVHGRISSVLRQPHPTTNPPTITQTQATLLTTGAGDNAPDDSTIDSTMEDSEDSGLGTSALDSAEDQVPVEHAIAESSPKRQRIFNPYAKSVIPSSSNPRNLRVSINPPLTQVQLCQISSQSNRQQLNEQLEAAERFLRQLECKCLVCQSGLCKGTCFLDRNYRRMGQKGPCFNCLGGHTRSECKTNWQQVVPGVKLCYNCLSFRGTSKDNPSHSTCSIECRLKRVLYEEKNSSQYLQDFVARSFSSQEMMLCTLANLCQKYKV